MLLASCLRYCSLPLPHSPSPLSPLRSTLAVLQNCVPKANFSNRILQLEVLSQNARVQLSTAPMSVSSCPTYQSVRRQKSLLTLHNTRYSSDHPLKISLKVLCTTTAADLFAFRYSCTAFYTTFKENHPTVVRDLLMNPLTPRSTYALRHHPYYSATAF